MKIFNTLQELWKYCKRCPFCQKSWRTISITFGPDTLFRHNTFYKVKRDTLYIYGKGKDLIFEIDMISNKFIYHGRLLSHDMDLNPYFYLQSTCNKCKKFNSYSNDSELSLNNHTYTMPFSLEGEWCRVTSDKGLIEIQQIYNDRITYIYKYKDNGNIQVMIGDALMLPLINFDFSIGQKLLNNKLQTILTFS